MRQLVDDIRKAVSKYKDVFVHDKDSWMERGESIGKESLCTITAEGELYHILNGNNRPKANDMTEHKLDDIARRHGCYIEQGNSWSWPFYTI